ncbi:MAG: alanine:cation symporter family protein [Deltaproteobacteria bacterium]|nr:alanine:cation symporter family protein [Deltaproteobacteria bacterium]MBW2445244.1 alanine:cation symporter family protein [Deltaproteobacteria bacterium]
MTGLEAAFGQWVVDPLSSVIFFDLWFWDNAPGDAGTALPIVVVWLILGATFFTLRFRFVNLRAFRHAIDCVRGRYDQPGDTGEISHFQALSAALSATVGLGNIAGVAVAVGLGGPGAVFWMVMAGFLGMSSKFAECTLGQRYRIVRPDGRISGGPMHYLKQGLAEIGRPGLGRALAGVFAFLCIGGSLGAGNMFQANQAYAQIANVVPGVEGPLWGAVFGVVLAFFVGLVIVGGIRRIGIIAASLVPFMCGVYVLTGAFILLANAGEVLPGLVVIVGSAFTPEAGYGGFVGVLIQGFRRACFSNEAGVGSAPIAHSAARTEEPVREGLVALLEPFIDTLVVCTMTGLVIVVTGAYQQPGLEGIAMTSWAFESVFPGFKYVLSLSAVLFAFSTQISWSYYGERAWEYLFGNESTFVFKGIFLFFVWFGAISGLARVVDFSDLLLLAMAFPNLIGVVLLSKHIDADLSSYLRRLRAGEFDRS